MFSSHQSDELGFQTLSYPGNEQEIQHKDPIIGHDNDVITNAVGKRKKKSSLVIQEDDHGGASGNKEKRVIHRDIERQRRQEMADLYASLRSLLPLEHIKGKRSISDHMHEAVNYINHLKKNMKELEIKREKLKKMSNFSSDVPATTSGSNCSDNSVTVSPCYGGLEILVIRSGVGEDEGFLLSQVMRLLVDEGIDVVSCVSTQVNGRLFHTIRCEVSEQMYVDVSVLEQKLCSAMNG